MAGITTRIVFYTLATSLPTSIAFSQDRCADIIPKVVATRIYKNDTNLNASLRYQACSMKFEEHKQTYGGSAEATFMEIGGSGSYNESNFEQFKSQHCTGLDEDQARSASQYFFQQTPDREAVKEWRKCMLEKEGLTCFAEPQQGMAEVPIVINWRSDLGTLPEVTDSSVSPGTHSRAVDAPDGKLLPQREILARGERTVTVVKPAHVALLGTLSVMIDGAGKSCRVFVPVEPRPAYCLVQGKEGHVELSVDIRNLDHSSHAYGAWGTPQEMEWQVTPEFGFTVPNISGRKLGGGRWRCKSSQSGQGGNCRDGAGRYGNVEVSVSIMDLDGTPRWSGGGDWRKIPAGASVITSQFRFETPPSTGDKKLGGKWRCVP